MVKAENYNIEPSVLSHRGTVDFFPGKKRKGYTLIEVMIAVTLTLVLMYALAAIFGRVTSIMTQTQDILSMTNNLRAAKDRLREDLENLTVPHLKAPTSQYGFFSYSEGLGGPFESLHYDELCRPNGSYNWNNYISKDVYLRIFRKDWNRDPAIHEFTLTPPYTQYGNFERRTVTEDNTIGDTDDILSFTVRAPAGKWFRGRCFKENLSDSDYDVNEDDNIEIIESEYAEVVWFLRGTTLYRRVLLIVPDEVLEKRLKSLNKYICYQIEKDRYGKLYDNISPNGEWHPVIPSLGYGFYRFFDVSVHFDSSKSFEFDDLYGSHTTKGRVVANTLSDLANRKNRFGYWDSPVINLSDETDFDQGLHGFFGSWYWLRMPTLQESALWTPIPNIYSSFRAGYPFGSTSVEPYDTQIDPNDGSQQISQPLDYWSGASLDLSLRYKGTDILPDNLPKITAGNLPLVMDEDNKASDFAKYAFIDQWQVPNPWIQQQTFSGQLNLANISGDFGFKELNNDILLTNVLSFDVKVWNEASSSFVNLGEQAFNVFTGETTCDPTDFRLSGNYGLWTLSSLTRLFDPATRKQSTEQLLYRPFMPAVFDTWTEDYEKDFLTQTWSLFIDGVQTNVFGASSRPGFTVGDIPLDGKVTSSDLPDYPPPYEAEVKVIQVELRAFDPVSRTIKNATVEIKIP